MKINQILDKIDDNMIFVPAFQREYVWKRDNVKNLIDSLIKEYPTGTILTWETNDPPELKGDWKYEDRQGAVKILLDGQQRVTSLYFLIRDAIPPYYEKKDILTDPRGLYVNISTLELQYYKKQLMENSPYWINITDIFQKKVKEKNIFRKLKEKKIELSDEEEDNIYDNYKAVESILDREFKEQQIPVKASLKDAIDIFYIVNDSGVNLTDAELALAQISGYWPEARNKFKAKLEEMKEKGFVFKLDFIIYCLLGILYSSGSEMSKLHNRDNDKKIKEAWEKLDNEILDYVLNILKSHAYVDHTDEINSVFALIPIVVFVHHHGKENISQERINKIVKWFYYSQIRQRYVSQLQQKLDKDIKIIVSKEAPFDELVNNISLERHLQITPQEFIGVGIRHSLYSLMRWYFKSQEAICLTTGVKLRQNMGKKYSLEWDHIFPFSLLKDRGYDFNNKYKYSLAQEITNRMVLTQIGNRKKGAKLPKEYFEQVKKNFPNALKLQVIPESEELWELDNFELFLEERRKEIASHLNNFLDNLTNIEESKTEMSVEELISEGESDELELKSSLRWDYKNEKLNTKIENVILKTISAFANSSGGKLIIGVDDDGEILGLNHDYMSLSGERDKFELHLKNLINKTFGKSFGALGVKIYFEKINDSDVCLVDIKKWNKELYLEFYDEKLKQKLKKFYVRSGNSSQELGLDEINDYINSRN
jgi:hypothetical protein